MFLLNILNFEKAVLQLLYGMKLKKFSLKHALNFILLLMNRKNKGQASSKKKYPILK